MEKEEVLKYWLEGAKDNVAVAKDMFKVGHYSWALFIWQLAVEKILKGKLTFQNKEVPYTHDLKKLLLLSGLPITEEITKQLNEITTFNLEARYDNYKLDFYKKATKEYTQEWATICERIYQWILEQIK